MNTSIVTGYPRTMPDACPIDALDVAAYRIPTDRPESDGTLRWTSTEMIVVHARAGDRVGLGYAYTSAAAARIVEGTLAPVVRGRQVWDTRWLWQDMRRAVRNLGARGVVSSAMAAVDVALWDLEARALGLPLAVLLGRVRDTVPVYGSGGFTSYTDQELTDQLGGWAELGIRWVKMKVGRQPAHDAGRVRRAREAIGPDVGLMVDANGGYTRKQALAMAERFAEHGVIWFEEPVSSDDLEGLRLLRDRAPAGMEITAGEYGYHLDYFRRMIAAGAVDAVQADVTRCAGITGFMQVATLCEAEHLPLSAHTAPAVHAHAAAAAPPLRHVEYFHDHVRIEEMFFEGLPELRGGALQLDLSREGHGLALRVASAEPFRVV